MSIVTHILSVLAALAGLGVLVTLLLRQRLRERHAIWWLIAGGLALVISIFPGILEWAAAVMGVELPTNLIFFVSIALLFGVCLQLSSELTSEEARSRALAEQIAMHDLRLRALEAEQRDDES